MDFVMPADAPALSPADRRAAIKWPTRRFYQLRWLRSWLRSFRKDHPTICWITGCIAVWSLCGAGFFWNHQFVGAASGLLVYLQSIVVTFTTIFLPIAAFAWFGRRLSIDSGKTHDASHMATMSKLMLTLWLTIMVGCAALIPFA